MRRWWGVVLLLVLLALMLMLLRLVRLVRLMRLMRLMHMLHSGHAMQVGHSRHIGKGWELHLVLHGMGHLHRCLHGAW